MAALLPPEMAAGFASALGQTEQLFSKAFQEMGQREAGEKQQIAQLPKTFAGVHKATKQGLAQNLQSVLGAGGGGGAAQSAMVREAMLPFQNAQTMEQAATGQLIPLFQQGAMQHANERGLALEQARAQEIANIRAQEQQAIQEFALQQRQQQAQQQMQREQIAAQQQAQAAARAHEFRLLEAKKQELRGEEKRAQDDLRKRYANTISPQRGALISPDRRAKIMQNAEYKKWDAFLRSNPTAAGLQKLVDSARRVGSSDAQQIASVLLYNLHLSGGADVASIVGV